jgi:hypothetical protein
MWKISVEVSFQGVQITRTYVVSAYDRDTALAFVIQFLHRYYRGEPYVQSYPSTSSISPYHDEEYWEQSSCDADRSVVLSN